MVIFKNWWIKGNYMEAIVYVPGVYKGMFNIRFNMKTHTHYVDSSLNLPFNAVMDAQKAMCRLYLKYKSGVAKLGREEWIVWG